ncbi:unnamed protein product [Clonostachys rosea f. rosea IK726]|uniref:Uncharacterized protein n=1 Tax=Clonostachys rosea f. rosea IK726 TaxID=1349383 RepID=A0ACA9U076_BIOOC|nr:unnamed protein product [Clonostachys rosea f. rosea IK726]
MASGTDTGAIISVNQTSDKAVFYLRPDGAFNCIPTINETGADYDLYDYAISLNEVSGSPRRLTFVRRDKPRETETWSRLFDQVTFSARENSGSGELKSKCLSITLLYLPSPMMTIVTLAGYGLDRRNQEP